MATCQVNLNSIEKIKSFVEALRKSEGTYELASGKYVINAKSIMGIFSLDLTKPIEFRSQTGVIPSAVLPFLA
ncbi:MAG: HPr family phosphocarrier protein [Lachnospiraceae bacterium]|nr:HPr family phosphocarrier protein [Lachnospiraceae bacterium]